MRRTRWPPLRQPRRSGEDMPITTTADVPGLDEEARTAARIFGACHASVTALYEAFWTVRQARGNPPGATTDQEQDILRAMLVMACSGLDAVLKQIIRDAIPTISAGDDGVRAGLESFVERKIKSPDGGNFVGGKLLARLLCSPSPVMAATDSYIYELTGDSLQSADQVMKTAAALGLLPQWQIDKQVLSGIFKLRNTIIHELDVNLNAQP